MPNARGHLISVLSVQTNIDRNNFCTRIYRVRVVRVNTVLVQVPVACPAGIKYKYVPVRYKYGTCTVPVPVQVLSTRTVRVLSIDQSYCHVQYDVLVQKVIVFYWLLNRYLPLYDR